MTGVAVVWLVVGLVTTVAVIAVLIALVRHVLVLGRSLTRFQREVGPIAQEIGAQGERATTRSWLRVGGGGSGRPKGRAVR
jgi:hypothetical protein